MNWANLSGLESLKLIVEGKIPPPSMALTMSLKIVKVEKGYAEFSAVADDRYLNPAGTVHGGFAATVLDSVTGCAVHTMLEAGDTYGTVDLNVKMLKPIPLGVQLIAKSWIIQVSSRLGTAYGTLTDDKGTLYSHATATCLITRKNSSPINGS